MQGNFSQIQGFQKTPLGWGWVEEAPHRVKWQSLLKACLTSPDLGNFRLLFALKLHWPFLGFSKVPLHVLFRNLEGVLPFPWSPGEGLLIL